MPQKKLANFDTIDQIPCFIAFFAGLKLVNLANFTHSRLLFALKTGSDTLLTIVMTVKRGGAKATRKLMRVSGE